MVVDMSERNSPSPRLIINTEEEASAGGGSENSRRRKDIELGILSPMITPVVKGVTVVADAVADNFLPKIQKVPWIHFFILTIFVAVP